MLDGKGLTIMAAVGKQIMIPYRLPVQNGTAGLPFIPDARDGAGALLMLGHIKRISAGGGGKHGYC
jgi:hypothetical protein